MRVLVTGATGFVASHLVPFLARDHEVYALGHVQGRIAAGGTPIVRDLRAPGSTDGLPDVDAVVHLAQANVAFPDGARDLVAVNTSSTVALLDYARRVGATRFVYASSASVYGASDRVWHEDDAPPAPDFYACTKLAGERFVRSYEPYLAATVLRLVAPYGPGQRNRMIPRLIESVRVGNPVRLNQDGRPRMNPIFIDDVLSAVDAVLATDISYVVNLAGDETVSVAEVAEAAGRVFRRQPEFEPSDVVAGDIVCDNRRLHALVGNRELVGIDEGIARTASASDRS